MASSEAEICSYALKLVGGKPITALSDVSREAKLCNTFYPKTLQEVLRMAPWPSARKEYVLAQDDPPVTDFTFKYSYQLPPDYIRIWGTSLDRDWGGNDDRWEIMGKKLVTDAAQVKILYVHRITDVLLFDTLLEKAITYDLAAKLVFPISNIDAVQEKFDKQRDKACASAEAIFTQEQRKKRFRSSMLTEVR